MTQSWISLQPLLPLMLPFALMVGPIIRMPSCVASPLSCCMSSSSLLLTMFEMPQNSLFHGCVCTPSSSSRSPCSSFPNFKLEIPLVHHQASYVFGCDEHCVTSGNNAYSTVIVCDILACDRENPTCRIPIIMNKAKTIKLCFMMCDHKSHAQSCAQYSGADNTCQSYGF